MWCCGQGKYNVLGLPDITNVAFYDEPEFKKHMRFYNDLFAFSALVIPQGWHHPNTGLSFVKILGKVYHKVYDLSYNNARFRNYSALYIDDGEARAAIAAQDDRLCPRIVDAISQYLREEAANPYIGLFKQLSEQPMDTAHIVFENTTRRTHGPNIGEQPHHTEVAAIISTENERYYPRSIAIWKVGQAKAHTVDVFHPLYEPFGYPLLYPHGTPGWHIDRPDNSGGRGLTLDRYVRCLLLSEPRFRDYDRLSETWLVDMYSRIEEQRLRFYQFAQQRATENAMRTAPLDELQGTVNAGGARQDVQGDETVQGEGGVRAGRVYLPNTFTGGPRYMRTKYLDAMAVVARKGGPTFFLTMTTNAKWPEITSSRRPGSTSQPDICSRVFHAKKQELLRDLRAGNFFGKPAYIMHVLEEQKRGLMHVHILFKLVDQEPKQNHEIDAFIRADIPSEEEAGGRLRKIVLDHMIHGPCGVEHNRTDLPCWDNERGSCEKRFPKPCTETTYTDERGFVFYKRDATNKATKYYRRRPITVNDTWVVPYNAALLLKYDCHINIELASQSKVVKYMFNYITKGVPLANIAVVDDDSADINEVERYRTQRYLGSSLCSWRVLNFDITGLEPSVTLLPVHLEGKQSVLFRPGNEGDAINRSSSLLILYFNRPNLPEMDELTYAKFYEEYMVETKHPGISCRVMVHQHPDGRHYVYKRQRFEKVCRMFWVAPNRGEQFYLRLMLNLHPCRGYQDLIAKGGPDCTTFQQAAINLGLANDGNEYQVAMEEARIFMRGGRLRSFFVLLCNVGAPAAVLWEVFKKDLSEDLLLHFPEDRSFTLALSDIDKHLRRHGSSNEEQGLPVVEQETTELDRERIMFSSDSQNAFVDTWVPRLTEEQRIVFDTVKDLVVDPRSAAQRALFLDGPGGYGKTLLLQIISAYVRSQGGIVLCVASSGIAALNLAGGTTAHAMFRLPLTVGPGVSYWSLTNQSQRAQLIREACLIIYDEISMCHRYLLEILDRSLQDLMGNNSKLFGGKTVLFSGDFRQCAPVVTGCRSPHDVVSASVRSSYIWDSVRQFRLTQPQRTAGDEEYSSFLLHVGEDNLEHITFGEGFEKQVLVPIPQVPYVTSLEDLIQFVYPESLIDNADACAKRAILCTLNSNVHEVNDRILISLKGSYYTLFSVDYVEKEDCEQRLEPELLHQVTAKGVPPHELRLKIGSVCLVTRNLNIADGVVNGTKVIVVSISPRLIRVRKPGQHGPNSEFCIPRIVFKFPVDKNSLLQMCRRQFPLMLCYAMSIHKSQGQTIELVGVDLRSDVFSHGQLYVALSRVRSAEHIRVLVPPEHVIDGTPFVKNIVYQDLL